MGVTLKKIISVIGVVLVLSFAVVNSRPNHKVSSESTDSSGVEIPPRPSTESDSHKDQAGHHAHSAPLNRTTKIDAKEFRGATGRHTRSGGYIDNGMGGMGTALLLQQIMASQNAAAHNGNCSSNDTPKSGMDMQAIMPMILAMQNQGTYRGGFSG